MQNSNLKTSRFAGSRNTLISNNKETGQNDSSKLKTDLKSRSYSYALAIIHFIDKLPKESTCFIIGKQLLRSATSIGANIIEAKAASSKKNFINFFNHALKSANESKFWLALLRDTNKAPDSETQELLQEAIEIANMLGSSILTLKGKRKPSA